MKKTISLLLSLVLCLLLCACGETSVAETAPVQATEGIAEQTTFHENMEAMIAQLDLSSITGDKAATVLFNSSDKFAYYTDEYLPENLRTREVEQVRYIVRRIEDAEFVGTYSNSTLSALRAVYTIEVMDLKTNRILGSKVFEGGNPPTVLNENSRNIGSAPDETIIQDWILSVIATEPTENSPKVFTTFYIQVPDGWGNPWLMFQNEYDPVTKERGSVNFYRELTKEGEWYTIQLPNWVTNIAVSAHPDSLGSSNWHETSKINELKKKEYDLWITVLDLEGNFDTSVQEP